MYIYIYIYIYQGDIRKTNRSEANRTVYFPNRPEPGRGGTSRRWASSATGREACTIHQKSTPRKSSRSFSGTFQWMISGMFQRNFFVQWYFPKDYHLSSGF